MGALFDFKCTCDSRLVYICQADAEKCIFVWTILSQTPWRTPQVTSDAGRISARIFWLFPKERRMLRKRDYQGRLSFHCFDRWMTDLATHRQKKVQAMSWKNLQMLEFCLFTWSWMGPINCAPNPLGGERIVTRADTRSTNIRTFCYWDKSKTTTNNSVKNTKWYIFHLSTLYFSKL